MLLVPFFCFITALGFAAFGIATAASVPKIDQFSYVTTLVITPLFLVAGTFFPIDQLPEGFQVAASSTRCTSSSSWCAARPSASRRPT